MTAKEKKRAAPVEGEYVGPLAHLRGEKALLQPRKRGWAAQFNTIGLARNPSRVALPYLRTDLGFHWHKFSAKDFKVPSDA